MTAQALPGADVIVVGGGIAGLSAAALLAEHCRVWLLEREPLFASHASGRNAAIFRPLEQDALSARLARRSHQLLMQLIGPSVLRQTGLLLVSAQPEMTAALAALARSENVPHELLTREALWRRAPSLQGGQVQHGVLLSEGGVLDLHALTTGLAKLAQARGARLRSGVEVARVEVRAGQVVGVSCRDGERIEARRVVLAAGAWSARLAAVSGAFMPLTPQRRHLVQLRAAGLAHEPVIWRLDDEVYYRAESQGVLASPCDETSWTDAEPDNDPAALLCLAQKLELTAPRLANAAVQRSWACLRTFAPDRELVAGADARIAGLYWLAGLGGRGMSTALAAAEILTAELCGSVVPEDLRALAARRFG